VLDAVILIYSVMFIIFVIALIGAYLARRSPSKKKLEVDLPSDWGLLPYSFKVDWMQKEGPSLGSSLPHGIRDFSNTEADFHSIIDNFEKLELALREWRKAERTRLSSPLQERSAFDGNDR
jgi:hypothetical protein